MASPGKRRRKKMGDQAPAAPEAAPVAPAPEPKVAPAPKPKKKKKSIFG